MIYPIIYCRIFNTREWVSGFSHSGIQCLVRISFLIPLSPSPLDKLNWGCANPPSCCHHSAMPIGGPSQIPLNIQIHKTPGGHAWHWPIQKDIDSYVFLNYIIVKSMVLLTFCVWFEVGVKVHVFLYEYPIDPAPFVKKTIIPHWIVLEVLASAIR